jgi:hypothetical protein
MTTLWTLPTQCYYKMYFTPTGRTLGLQRISSYIVYKTRKLNNTALLALVFKFIYGVGLIAKIFLYVTGTLLSTKSSAVTTAEVGREDRKRPVNYHK